MTQSTERLTTTFTRYRQSLGSQQQYCKDFEHGANLRKRSSTFNSTNSSPIYQKTWVLWTRTRSEQNSAKRLGVYAISVRRSDLKLRPYSRPALTCVISHCIPCPGLQHAFAHSFPRLMFFHFPWVTTLNPDCFNDPTLHWIMWDL